MDAQKLHSSWYSLDEFFNNLLKIVVNKKQSWEPVNSTIESGKVLLPYSHWIPGISLSMLMFFHHASKLNPWVIPISALPRDAESCKGRKAESQIFSQFPLTSSVSSRVLSNAVQCSESEQDLSPGRLGTIHCWKSHNTYSVTWLWQIFECKKKSFNILLQNCQPKNSFRGWRAIGSSVWVKIDTVSHFLLM